MAQVADLYKVQNTINGEWVYVAVDREGVYMELSPILRWFGITEEDLTSTDFTDCVIPEGSAEMVNITCMALACVGSAERDRHMKWINATGTQFGWNCKCGTKRI